MSGDDMLAERLARAEIGEKHYRRYDNWFLQSIERHAVKSWRERIEIIRRAGLELTESGEPTMTDADAKP